ncbi:ribonuclease Z [Halorussus salilacus]|uniref:ribonuclease Z n=1 Tax=Halorussus salilacus TaxID=2953750 RepID=UPI0020A08362|nr:ribonuclease Z [Halorussus salilacus]USZ67113.1 ribonuclease Z [Halorussus salilacus]
MSMRVTFLGTSGAVPTTERNPSAVLVNREGDRLLFDVGEGTQRQMMRFGTGFTVSEVFITHLHGDHVLGLPGLVQTWDFNDREEPLSIYTPRGTGDDIDDLVHAAGNRPSFPIHVYEVEPGEVAARRDDYEIRTFRTDHRTTSVGYALVEDDRKGRFDRERAEELGVPVGPKFSRLHEGNPVELEDGTVVRPEQVVGDPRPGRTFVYTGDTRPTDEVSEAAADADLLVHDATFADDRRERASETGHATAREAAELASDAGAVRLALTHISSRYAGDVSDHLAEARDAFDGEVFVPDDGEMREIPYPDK